jgi:hypothetical protein
MPKHLFIIKIFTELYWIIIYSLKIIGVLMPESAIVAL